MSDGLYLLTTIPAGSYKCSKWFELWKPRGWLAVERDGDTTFVMWTSHKDYHCSFYGKSIIVDVDKFGNLEAYYETAISLWLKWKKSDGANAMKEKALKRAKWMESVLRKYSEQSDNTV